MLNTSLHNSFTQQNIEYLMYIKQKARNWQCNDQQDRREGTCPFGNISSEGNACKQIDKVVTICKHFDEENTKWTQIGKKSIARKRLGEGVSKLSLFKDKGWETKRE